MTSNHDALFKSIFADPKHASFELRSVLPGEIANHLDWTSLRLESADLPGTDLERRSADVLFSVQLAGRPAFLYLLFEHKSSPDRFTAVQVLGYVVRIWERFLLEHKSARLLPPVLPVVVYHHRKRWRYRTDLLSLIDVDPELSEHLAPLLPSFRFLLDDVTAPSEAELRARSLSPLGRLAFLCFRRIRGSRDLLSEVVYLVEDMRAARRAHGEAALAPIFAYIMGAGVVDIEALRRIVATMLGPELEVTLKTTAERLQAEARTEATADLLLSLLAARFGPVPPEVAARVRSAPESAITAWAKRTLTAASIDDVFAVT